MNLSRQHGLMLVCDIRVELCNLIARRAPCVDRIADMMGVSRDAVWARLDGRAPLTLMDVSDICAVLGATPHVSLERKA